MPNEIVRPNSENLCECRIPTPVVAEPELGSGRQRHPGLRPVYLNENRRRHENRQYPFGGISGYLRWLRLIICRSCMPDFNQPQPETGYFVQYVRPVTHVVPIALANGLFTPDCRPRAGLGGVCLLVVVPDCCLHDRRAQKRYDHDDACHAAFVFLDAAVPVSNQQPAIQTRLTAMVGQRHPNRPADHQRRDYAAAFAGRTQ